MTNGRGPAGGLLGPAEYNLACAHARRQSPVQKRIRGGMGVICQCQNAFANGDPLPQIPELCANGWFQRPFSDSLAPLSVLPWGVPREPPSLLKNPWGGSWGGKKACH